MTSTVDLPTSPSPKDNEFIEGLIVQTNKKTKQYFIFTENTQILCFLLNDYESTVLSRENFNYINLSRKKNQ